MKTMMFYPALVVCLLVLAGCEDDRIYPSPQKKPLQNSPDVYVTVPVHLESEFNATFTRNIYFFGDDPQLDDLWNPWWGELTDQNEPVYQFELKGNGTDSILGIFTLHLTTVWSVTEAYCTSNATITSSIPANGGTLCLNCYETSDFNADYPYDQPVHENSFVIGTTLGYAKDCEGFGTILFIRSETIPDVMKVKLEADLKFIISKQ